MKWKCVFSLVLCRGTPVDRSVAFHQVAANEWDESGRASQWSIALLSRVLVSGSDSILPPADSPLSVQSLSITELWNTLHPVHLPRWVWMHMSGPWPAVCVCAACQEMRGNAIEAGGHRSISLSILCNCGHLTLTIMCVCCCPPTPGWKKRLNEDCGAVVQW